MKEALQLHWDAARRHEAAGDIASAKAAYESMLALEPMQVVPQLRLSRFAQMSDRYVAARAHALHASRIASVTHAARDVSYVTLRLLAFAEDGEVARLIRSMDWNDPDIARQAAVLSQHLWLVGRHAMALEFLTHVAARVRPNALLCHTRADVLRSLGRLEEATEHYEYALRLSPHDAHTHRALAYHQPARPADARLARIRGAQKHHAPDSPEQAQLCFALFKELDASGDTDGAWAALERGAAIMHALVRHDPAQEAEAFAQLAEAPFARPSATRTGESGQPTPIFIVGMPRTGTTLLDRILGNRSDTWSAGERNDFAAAISEASDHFHAGGLADAQRAKLQGMDHARAGAIYLARIAKLAEGPAAFVIDKNPQNFFDVGSILQALPHARILCLRRDPMDACFSNLKEPFEGGAYPYSYAMADLAAHHRGFTALARRWQERAPDAFRIVRYEDLVRDGEATLAGVLAFCGMRPEAGMLDITANAAPVSTASSSQVRQPIHGRGIGAWKRYATQLEPLRAMLGAEVA